MINTTRKVYDKTGMGFQLLQRKMLWRAIGGMGSRFHCLLSLTAMVLILLSNPSSSCHEDQPSRCDSVSSFLIITDIKVDSLSLLVSLLSVKSTLGTKSQ